MNEYEILLEDINPCGGEQYAKKVFLEAKADSPEAYIASHDRWPILEQSALPDGSSVIVTGDGKGNVHRYTFTEI